MKYFLIGIIKFYQLTPLHSHSLCRFQPTCSQYTMEAIIKYGSIRGCYMGLKRIIRCHPGGSSGYDPVPNSIKNKKGNNYEKN